MGDTYTRQSSYTDGDVITAAHTNDEFNQLLAAFASSTGHSHDGTTGEGGPITKLLSNALTFGAGTAGTDITITFDGETADGVLKWMEDEDYFEFSDDILIASTEKLQFRDTAIYINSSTDGQLDLVADTEIQIAATTIDINGNADVSGNLTVGGSVIIGGNTLSSTELLFLDGITAGTVTASKALVVDSNKDIASLRNITLTGELDAGSLDVSGDADIDGTLETDALSIDGTTITATAAELNYNDTGASVGTVVASKTVTVDANKDVASFRNITLTGELDAGSLDVSGDADIDGTLEADAITVGGTALNTVIAGVTVTNATTAAVATTVTISDNESTNEENAVIFTSGGDVDGGNIGLESDGDLTYNPSTGTVTATIFKGNIDAVDGDFDGTLEADAITVAGVSLATFIRDTVGTNMVSSNTESGITVTYDTSNDNIDFSIDAAQTGITSLLATDIKIGEDDETKIDFETANEIHFYAANAEQVYVADGIFGPQTDSDVDLGSDSVRWKDAYIDTITTTGAVTVGGDLTVNGTTTTVNSTTTTVDDPVFTLGGDSAPGSDDNKDRGIEFRYHDGSSAKIGFFGFDDSAGKFTFIPDASNSSEVFSGTAGTIVANLEGNVTGNASGTAATVTGAAQSNITSLGTLTTLTVDNIIVNGTTIGHTDDTDLITLADGIATVAGEISVTTLDIGGTNVTSTAAELNILDGVTATATELNIIDGDTTASSTTLADADRVVTNDNGTMKQVALTDVKTYLTSAGFTSDDPTALAIALG
jgi:cytoskeletal protein CcmA (bactofilin family)